MDKLTIDNPITIYQEQEFQIEYEMAKSDPNCKPAIVFSELRKEKVRINFPSPNILDFSFSHLVSCEFKIINDEIHVNLLWSQSNDVV